MAFTDEQIKKVLDKRRGIKEPTPSPIQPLIDERVLAQRLKAMLLADPSFVEKIKPQITRETYYTNTPVPGPRGAPGRGIPGEAGKTIVGPRGLKGPKGDSVVGPRGPRGWPGETPSDEHLLSLIKPLIEGLRGEFQPNIKLYGTKKSGRYLHGGGISRLTAGAGVTLTADGNGGYTIAVSGITFSEETPTGSVNGSNTTFTTSNTPLFVIIDGIIRVSGQGYTYASPTITVDSLIPPVQFIRSYYLA